jgi:hypothetical protein
MLLLTDIRERLMPDDPSLLNCITFIANFRAYTEVDVL